MKTNKQTLQLYFICQSICTICMEKSLDLSEFIYWYTQGIEGLQKCDLNGSLAANILDPSWRGCIKKLIVQSLVLMSSRSVLGVFICVWDLVLAGLVDVNFVFPSDDVS